MKKCTKRCCDCQNVKNDPLGLEFSDCHAPQNIDKATMNALKLVGIDNPPNRYRMEYASIQRSAGWLWSRVENRCGKEGRWFVPRKEA